MGENEDAYSAFQARDTAERRLATLLGDRGVTHLFVMGLATDYCVKASALAGLENGLRITVVADGIRAVNLQPDDGQKAIDDMRQAGVEIST